MQFRIADTFTESLARLNGEEQRAAKTTAFDLQLNPAQPGLQFHRVNRARDKNFWSVRVSQSVRMIAHKTAANLLLCYVGEHDDAYRWAERRRLEQHPHTGAAQLVEIRIPGWRVRARWCAKSRSRATSPPSAPCSPVCRTASC